MLTPHIQKKREHQLQDCTYQDTVWESSKRNDYIVSPGVTVKAIFITPPIRPLSLSLHPTDMPAVITIWISVSTTVYYGIDLPLVYSGVPDCSAHLVRNFKIELWSISRYNWFLLCARLYRKKNIQEFGSRKKICLQNGTPLYSIQMLLYSKHSMLLYAMYMPRYSTHVHLHLCTRRCVCTRCIHDINLCTIYNGYWNDKESGLTWSLVLVRMRLIIFSPWNQPTPPSYCALHCSGPWLNSGIQSDSPDI